MIDNSSAYLKPKDFGGDDFGVAGMEIPSFSFGKCIILGTSDSRFKVVIGPHWYVSMIGFLLILFIGNLVFFSTKSSMGAMLQTVYLLIFGFTLLMYCVMFLKDPGIIPQKRGVPVIDVESRRLYSCLKCLAYKEDKAVHCEDCDVCIEEFDHHCVWVGKCVGRRNLVAFYIFVASIPVFFVFIMFMSAFLSVEPNKEA